MRFAKIFLGVFVMLSPLFLTNTTNAFETDDEYTPQVTVRVARITFLKGDVQIKRAGNESWEVAAQNLPLAEGDEITTSIDARLEIQFDSYNHLRLADNSYLKLTTLRDDGIAVSLPQGTLNLRVSEFDKDKEFFEIDAPKTTLAVQQTGMYRVDAGDTNSTEVRVTATEKGEARVYSGNSGFTLKTGRTAKIFLDGNLAGEWETADASRYADEFDSWALERDTAIAKRLRDSYYDKYYDRDISGADDLNEYGEWIYTRKYGYVWKPYANSVSSYSNWSPYRYGHWRWFPPYGWTWVNDEPWGWATYHYGRWVYDNNGWFWSPYSYRRHRRNWWNPALVYITYSGGYICWYPLPYQYNYYNYNAYYYNNTTIINNNTTVVVNPTPNPTPRQDGIKQLTNTMDIPINGIISVSADQFGIKTNGFQTAPLSIAKNVLTKSPVESTTTPILPNYKQINGKIGKNIAAETPKIVKTETPVKTGVIDRQTGISMSDKIQKERVLDNRTTEKTVKTDTNTNTTVRDTGAVTRTEQTVKQNQTTTQTDRNTTRNPVQTDTTIRSTGGGNTTQTDRNTTRNDSNNNTQQTDRNTQRNEQQTDRNQNQPVKNPQQTQQNQTQRNEQQPTKQQPQQQQQQKKEEQKPQQQQEQKKEEQKPQQQQQTEQEKDG